MNNQSDHTKNIHLYGIEYGRALLSVFVVAWHFKVFGITPLFDRSIELPYRPSWMDVINANVLLIAVPWFLLASSYLYARRQKTIKQLLQRCIYFLSLMLFWALLSAFFSGGIQAVHDRISALIDEPLYEMSIGMSSIYYFFFSLSIVMVLTHICMKLENRFVAVWAISGAALLVFFQYMTQERSVGWTSAFWNPLNFLIIPPIAVLITRSVLQPKMPLIILLVLASTTLAVLEWRYLVNTAYFASGGFAFPVYTRVSLYLISLAGLLLCLRIHQLPITPIRFMSDHSLSLYILHPFVITYFWQMGTIGFFLTIAFCYVIAVTFDFLRNFFQKKLRTAVWTAK